MGIFSKCFFFLCMATGLQAQPAIKWSQPFECRNQPDWLGYRQGNFYFSSQSKDSGVQVWTYAPDGKQICRSAHDPKGFGKAIDYKWTTLNQNGPFHYYLEDIKKEGLRLSGLFATPDCSTYGALQPLTRPDEVKFYSPYRTGTSPNGDFTIKYRDIITTKGGMLHYLIFDKSGKLFAFDSYNFGALKGILTEAFVDNNGIPYMLLRNFRLKKERQPGQAEEYPIWVKLEKGREAKVYPLDFPNLQFAGVDVLPAPDNRLYLAGFAYPFEGEPKHLIQREVITSSMDIRTNNKDILATRMLLFEYDAQQEALDKKMETDIETHLLFDTASKKADELIPYAVRQVYPLENGGYQMVCEQFQFVRMISGTNTNYFFKFYDIAVIETGGTGKAENVWKFAKRQTGGAEASVLSTRVNGHLHVLYADLLENERLTPGEKPALPANKDEKNGLFMATIAGGKLEQKSLIYRYEGGQPVPQILLSTVTAPGEVMLMAKEQFGILKLE